MSHRLHTTERLNQLPPYSCIDLIFLLQTAPLFSCLVKHPDYYGPQIDSMAAHSRAEQAGGDPATAATEARRPISSSDRSSTTNGSIAAAAAAASVVEPAGRANVRGG